MSDNHPRAREISSNLLARELERGGVANGKEEAALAALRTFDRLRSQLENVVGVAGYQALLARARAMSRGDVAWLAPVRVRDDGKLDGFLEAALILDATEIARGSTHLLGSLIALLIRLVGEPMTLRLIEAAGPAVAAATDPMSGPDEGSAE